ncbi:phage major capsid protein [Streptomyces spinosirectus]|jgi:HK97 family phage major capsid protein|uniref:phage major capsid protein n=1 Tax=Streptomyces TaxID=1883 RepID=UPI001C9D6773|nr:MULTISPECIES: phage major capsid protein [Streptomyces]MBY8342008.1 phage major capsid protein [Streptomyces plumbidurans]UIR16645.1 phage major capsid protein [Streptomyces spinosirectus]
MDERLKRLIARREQAAKDREQLLAQRKAIVDIAEEEAREDLSPEEDTEFRGLTEQVKTKDEEIRAFDERITELSEEAEREQQVTAGAAAVRRAQARVQSVTEGRTYDQHSGRSYMQDLMRVQLNMDGDGTAIERLRRHAQEVETDKEYRDLTRTDGAGGYFVPPLWLMSQYVELARAGRAYANLCNGEALPPGTDSINIPKLATGTATGIQTADNGSVQETDLTDTSVTAPVRTIAGQQDVAIQLLDQSPISFDQVIFRDLVADYATKLDLQVISGSGSSGQVTGVRNTSNIVTISAGTATVSAIYSKIADAVQRVHTSRFMPPTVIVMHPRRWAWFLAAVDSQGRPLVVPDAGNPMNAVATLGAVGSQQVVGQMHGLPVVTDPSIPTTLGTSTTEDVIHVLRASDLLLFESGIRTRVLPDVGSGNLTVRLQVYGYLAFTAGRYPQSVVEIGGAGLVAPSF